MKVLKCSSAVFRGSLTILSTVLLAACTPSNGSSSDKAQNKSLSGGFSTLDQTSSTCEQSLRNKILNQTLTMVDSPRIQEEVNLANALIKSPKGADYGLTQVNNQNQSITVKYGTWDDSSSQTITYTLSLNDNSVATSKLSLDINFDNDTPQNKRNTRETFLVSDGCQLSLVSSYSQILRHLDSYYAFSSRTDYAEGAPDIIERTFTLPEGGQLFEFMTDQESNSQKQGYSYSPTDGLLFSKFTFGADQPLVAFGLNLNLKIINYEISKDGKIIGHNQYAYDKSQGVSRLTIDKSNSWALPKSVWDSQSLGSYQNSAFHIDFKLSKDEQTKSSQMKLLAPDSPSYDHFAAYFSIEDAGLDQTSGLKSMILTETFPPIVKGSTTDQDLISNDTIQTDLPQIQKEAQSILAQQPTDRKEQIQLILQYLKNHYTYDTDMLAKNIVRPLTTQEALDLGHGVCQHYSVIYTALARAIKIPTRIVFGFFLEAPTPGGHAWVESEIAPGTWQVIEPQDPKALTRTHTRRYMPLGRATFLEDKNAAILDASALMHAVNYTFLPVQ